jgi:GxxExxY protein
MDAESFPDIEPNASDPETFAIIGAAMEVHRELGCGFLEPVCQEALALELSQRRIPFIKEAAVEIAYKGTTLATTYRTDFICHNSIILELKAVDSLTSPHRSQVINYLNATNFTRALLLNFGSKSLQHQRFAHTPHQNPSPR